MQQSLCHIHVVYMFIAMVLAKNDARVSTSRFISCPALEVRTVESQYATMISVAMLYSNKRVGRTMIRHGLLKVPS